MFDPRPMQKAILEYKGGKMGVAAVPGSGKTHTLSCLAANLVSSVSLRDDQEILIVTLVNSAVDNFTQRVQGFLVEKKLIPNLGYRVRTLHGLDHDIVRERPDLVGLSDQFTIIDEKESERVIQGIIGAWLRTNTDIITQYSIGDQIPSESKKLRDQWQDLAFSVAKSFIREAKDLQVSPSEVQNLMNSHSVDSLLLKMGHDIYSDYQRALNFRSAVDFDDLIHLALKALRTDPGFLQRLQYRWPYILEDEAQDSSRLQEQIIRLLTAESGNWVRVGDTNQAIYESFTTANPQYLRHFLKEPEVVEKNLANSGRSTASIISLANHLITWTREKHPVKELRESLNLPLIELTPRGDPQSNPLDDPAGIRFLSTAFTPDSELLQVVKEIEKWIPNHRDSTVAVLVPRNARGNQFVAAFRQKGIPCVEHLQSTFSTRRTAEVLSGILDYFCDPTNPAKLSHSFKLINTFRIEKSEIIANAKKLATTLNKCRLVEDYLSPAIGMDWLSKENLSELENSILVKFRDLLIRWQKATLLPIDQFLLTISQDIFTEVSDLALAHKVSLLLDQAARSHPEWGLPEFTEELDLIAKNERKFLGFSQDDTGFNPDEYKGQVLVSTIHKAKGLEWDRIYLVSVNNYDFPSAQPQDFYLGEKYFIRDKLNLEAETLSKLDSLATRDVVGLHVEEGPATLKARLQYSAERIRLLFVGITRARKELIISFNTGRRNDCQPAVALMELKKYWEKEHALAE
jgi:DNA helicase II / ATP-dependent DNA helicase PcrA